MKRKYWLRQAADKLKAVPSMNARAVKIEWKDRTVTVNDGVAFEQGKTSFRASFVGDFANLSLD